MAAIWSYGDARSSQTGTMVCGACQKKITEGEFRYRQKPKGGDWGYSQQHRGCSAADPEWARRDAAKVAAAEHWERFVAACIAFRNEWKVDELNDYIPEESK